MGHMITGDQFYAERGISVWHPQGPDNRDENLSAREASEKYNVAQYGVSLRELSVPFLVQPDASSIVLPERVILRDPLPEDPEYRSFGIVGPNYHLVDPSSAIRMWDEYVGMPVQTMGVLYDGAAIFFSAKLPSMDVRGEPVDNNLVFVSWMKAGAASLVMNTSVCPVCANTVKWGEQAATEKLRIIHDSTVQARTADWLMGAVARATNKVETLHELAQTLATRIATDEATVAVLKAAYVSPNEPRKDCPPEVFQERFERYEVQVERTIALRESALDLFEGKGTGMDLPSRRGTMWGLVQAVAELESYRSGGSVQNIGQSVLVGARGDAIERAVDQAVSICLN